MISSAVAVSGLVVSYLVYGKRPASDPLATKIGIIYPILKNKYYFDVLYGWYVDSVQQGFAKILFWFSLADSYSGSPRDKEASERYVGAATKTNQSDLSTSQVVKNCGKRGSPFHSSKFPCVKDTEKQKGIQILDFSTDVW